MHPTPPPRPSSVPSPVPSPSAAPASLVIARVVAGLQLVLAAFGLVAGALLAAGSATSDRAAAADGDPNAWAGFGVAIGVLVGVVCLLVVLALGIPLLVMRGSKPTSRATGHGLLIGGEALLVLPTAMGLFRGSFGLSVFGGSVVNLVVTGATLVALAVIGCLLTPASRRWAYGTSRGGATDGA